MQPTKRTQTEASNNEHRDSTLNKGTNSQLTSEYLEQHDLSALITQTVVP